MSRDVELADQEDLKALGVSNFCIDLEIWNERLCPEKLPGRTKVLGRGEWLKRLGIAVEVLGRGHVGANLEGGIEPAPKFGFLSRDDAANSPLEAFDFLIARGIVPWLAVWAVSPLSREFQVDDSPHTEFYLRLGGSLHELLENYSVYKELGFYGLGVDAPTIGLYGYYCCSMRFSRDYTPA